MIIGKRSTELSRHVITLQTVLGHTKMISAQMRKVLCCILEEQKSEIAERRKNLTAELKAKEKEIDEMISKYTD